MKIFLVLSLIAISLFGCVNNHITPLKHEWLTYRDSLKSWHELPRNQYHEVLSAYNDKTIKLLKKRKIIRLNGKVVEKYTESKIPARKNAYLVRSLVCKFNQTGGLSVYSNIVAKKLTLQFSAFGNCLNILEKAVVVFVEFEPVDLFVELSLAK